MLISKFNKMIRNRLLWGIFAAIVSISFVGMFTADGGCEGANHADPVVGKAGDLTVTQGELQRAHFFSVLHISLMTGRPFSDLSPEMMDELEKLAWRRALSLKKAEQLGLHATDHEVLEYIRQDPMFSHEGVFQRYLYDHFADMFLARLGVSRRHYDDFVREEVLLQKLMRSLGASVWISPAEMDRHLQSFTDVFSLQSVLISTNLIAKVEDPAISEIEEYYQVNSNEFVMPDRRIVAYVSFPSEDYMDAVTVDELDVEAYYHDNLHEFRRASVANGDAGLDLEMLDGDIMEPEEEDGYITLEEASGDIREKLKQREALFAAMDAATDFVMQLVPRRRDLMALTFDEAAAQHGLVVSETKPFSRFDPPPELDDIAPSTLVTHAFGLADTPEEYFSNAVDADEAAYVLALIEKIPAGVPPLEEIVDRVRKRMMRERIDERVAEYASEFRGEIIAAMHADPDLTFEKAVAAYGREAREYEPFSIFNAPDELEDAEILNAIIGSNTAEITEPIFMDYENRLVIYVGAREPIDDMSRHMLRRQIGPNLYGHRARQLFAEWQDNLFDRLEKQALPERDDEDRDMGRRPIL